VRILVGHNYYQQPGGEDSVFRSEAAMLKDFGHDVCVYERHNNEIKPGIMSRLSHAASLRFSKSSYDQMRSLIRSFRPDVAHFHNIFFAMTPSVLYACKDEKVPVTFSLHNFRLMCINGLFFRDGKPCEDCLHGSRMSGIIHQCYRHSFAFSILATDMIDHHWRRKTWTDIVDHFVVATEFTRGKYVQAGIPSAKITVLPNFAKEPPHHTPTGGGSALYVGRLSREKGTDLLLKAWRHIKDLPLNIVGQGPMQKDIESYINDHGLTHVRMSGFLKKDDYIKVLSQAKFLIVPSVCYENFPVVIAEAFACGVPVLANRLGTMEEIVEDGRTGLLFSNSDPQDLAAKAMDMVSDGNRYAQLCANARQAYHLKYTPAKHYEGLMNIYQRISVHA
jgi:glycosyltransferase involved in cell wall biosynthesis